MLAALAACSAKNSQSPSDSASTAADGIVFNYYDENGNPVTEIVSTTGPQPSTDPNSETSIIIPLAYISTLEKKYQDDLQLYCTDNGFISYLTDEENKTVTFTMTAAAYNDMLFEKRRDLNHKLISLIESETYPYFRKYTNSSDYTQITLFVERDGYEKADFPLILVEYAGSLSMHNYQIFTTDTVYSCTVTVKDAQTDEIITEKVFDSVYSQ